MDLRNLLQLIILMDDRPPNAGIIIDLAMKQFINFHIWRKWLTKCPHYSNEMNQQQLNAINADLQAHFKGQYCRWHEITHVRERKIEVRIHEMVKR